MRGIQLGGLHMPIANDVTKKKRKDSSQFLRNQIPHPRPQGGSYGANNRVLSHQNIYPP